MSYSWVGFFAEMLEVVCNRFDAESLAKTAHEIFSDTTALQDELKDGKKAPLAELDPLTFVGFFNRSLSADKRTAYCKVAKEKLELRSEVPSDFHGIPTINNQASWFFPYSKERGPEVFPNLWKFAQELASGKVNDDSFSKVIAIKGVGLAKLTQICFICKPDKYLPLDRNTTVLLRDQIGASTLDSIKRSERYEDYMKLLSEVAKHFPNESLRDISAKAYIHSSSKNYWVVGASWGKDENTEDKTQEFVQNGVWINGYGVDSGDKSLDRVKQVSVGDMIAIKSSSTKGPKGAKVSFIRVKAVGQVTENAADGRHLKVNWLFKGPPFDLDGVAYMQTIHQINDLTDRRLIFENGFKTETKQSNSADVPNSPSPSRITDLPKNLILFGPPGVGKTYRMQGLMARFVSSSSEADSTRLTGWVSELPWWKVIAACLIDLNKKASVQEIFEHKFLQAKLKLSANNTPKNAIWLWLQSHAVETSKTVRYKKRVEPQVFDKNEDSTWFLAGDWQDALADLQAQMKTVAGEGAEPVKRFETVTFHQSYSYEDFVEGIRPVAEDAEEPTYRVESGVFKNICDRAKADPNNDYAIFIDEINRANVSKVFGELITLIEDDKRSGKQNAATVRLPYSKTEFQVPENLFIIGTMNSADRSIAILDIALRRRFRFQRMEPDPSLILQESSGVDVRAVFEELNSRISVLIGEDYQIGHSYLMPDAIRRAEGLKNVWFESILPLLREYFFDDWEKLKALVPSFIEERAVKGLDKLGVLTTNRYFFVRSDDVSDDEFTKRLSELNSFLKAA